jgi:peptidyl-prolyl cis-trans isomerase SurA
MAGLIGRGSPALLLVLGTAVPLAAQGVEEAQLVDRIVAVVDEDPILASDLDRVIGLGLVEAEDGESEASFRRRVLDQVIAEKLRFQEIDRFGFTEVSISEVDQRFEEIRSRFESEEVFAERMAELGLEAEGLRQLVARQIMVLTYVDERLGPRVFVGREEIQQYYDETLVPELRRTNQPLPGLTEVHEEIRQVLKEQRLNEEIERWTEELRREADIDDYLDQRQEGLPGIVLGVQEDPG